MKKPYALLFVALISTVLFLPSLQYGFSQDDFIHLHASRAENVNDFLNFFNPFATFDDIFFYRPLATQVYFFLNHSLFGLNPVPFRVIALVLHVANALLIYEILKKLLRNITAQYTLVSSLSALLYSVSAVHFLSIYYISAFQQISRTFFIFLAVVMYINYQQQSKKIFLVASLVSFLCALLSKETSVILPLLLLPIEIIRCNTDKVVEVLKRTLQKIVPYFLMLAAYVILRILGFQSIFSVGAYDTKFSIIEIAQNLKWYTLWSIGLPEVLATYPSLSFGSLAQFTKDFPFALPVLILAGALLLGIVAIVVTGVTVKPRIIVSFLAIAVIALLPVLPLYQHRYPQYLDLALLAILPIVLLNLFTTKYINKILSFAVVSIFIVLQLLSLELTRKTHWTTHRAEVADYYYNLLQTQYSTMPENSVVVFDGDEIQSREVSVALAKHYAVQVWYGDTVDRVIYKSTKDTTDLNTIVGQIVIPITKY